MKRFFAIALSLMLLLSLAACKEELDPGTNGAPGGSSTVAPDSTNPTADTNPPDGVDRSAVRILSGVAAADANGTKPYEYVWETLERRLMTTMTAKAGGTEMTVEFTYRESERMGTVTGLPSGVVIDFVWDENGRIVSMKETSTGGTHAVACVYDADGRCVEKTVSRDGELACTITTQYEGGKLTEEITTLPDGSVSNQRTCAYNEKGDLTQETVQWTGSPAAVKKYTYTYNDAGKPVSRITLDAEDNQTAKEAYTYDAEGRILTLTAFDGDTRTSHTEYTYDDSGDLVKEQHLTGEEVSRTVEYTYTEVQMSDAEYQLYQMLLDESKGWY